MTDIYDVLAPDYRNYVKSRKPYIDSVDEYILENIPSDLKSILDIGAGDGIRGMTIASRAGIAKTVLVEPSVKMVSLCRKLKPTEIYNATAETLPVSIGNFDVILCLWNVLGHIDGRQNRVTALVKMRQLLSDEGVLFIDVNNRHNATAYGKFQVFKRFIVDSLLPDEKRGDASFDWKIGDRKIPAMGHLFTPSEMETLFIESGLKIKKRIAIDYSNGRRSKNCFKGQLLYIVQK